jgi:hypothetical protein
VTPVSGGQSNPGVVRWTVVCANGAIDTGTAGVPN